MSFYGNDNNGSNPFYQKKTPFVQKVYQGFRDILNAPRNRPDFRPNFGGYSNYQPNDNLANVPAFRPNIGASGNTPLYDPSKEIPGYNFNPYQISTGDTFESIAKKHNMTVEQIQAANGGMLVPPPNGSRINIPIPPQAQNAPVGYGPYWNAVMSDVSSMQPNNYNVDMRGRGYGGNQAANNAPYTGWDSQRNDTVSPQTLNDLQSQVANGQAPMRVPVGALAQLGATPQSMVDAGYAFDPVSRTYVLSTPQTQQQLVGAPAGGSTTGSGNDWTTNPRLRLVMHGRNAKNRQNRYTETLQHARNDWKRKKRGPTAPPVVSDPVQGGTTPTTVLDLHLGGG